MNAVEIEEAVSKLAEAPFDTAEFPYAFLEAFGDKSTTLKRLKSGSSNHPQNWRYRRQREDPDCGRQEGSDLSAC
jgi:hypothetical protein